MRLHYPLIYADQILEDENERFEPEESRPPCSPRFAASSWESMPPVTEPDSLQIPHLCVSTPKETDYSLNDVLPTLRSVSNVFVRRRDSAEAELMRRDHWDMLAEQNDVPFVARYEAYDGVLPRQASMKSNAENTSSSSAFSWADDVIEAVASDEYQ